MRKVRLLLRFRLRPRDGRNLPRFQSERRAIRPRIMNTSDLNPKAFVEASKQSRTEGRSGSRSAHCSPGDYYHGSDGAIICACCDYEADIDNCTQCEDGFDGHDCGEDCCCCLYPDENVVCDHCRGRGCTYWCISSECAAVKLVRRIEANAQADQSHTQ